MDMLSSADPPPNWRRIRVNTVRRRSVRYAHRNGKMVNSQKGFGFIQPDQRGADVFVHVSAVERAGLRGLDEGQKVSYELMQDKRSGKSSADELRTL